MNIFNPVKNIIRSKLIACVALLHPGQKGTCLDLPTTLKVIRLSRTGALIYHVPSKGTNYEDIEEYNWTFQELLYSLDDVSSYDILANTSRSTNSKEAIAAARSSVEFFYTIRHLCRHQSRPIIKLEILNANLESKDSEVIEATKELVENDHLTVIPLLSPNIENIIACTEIGVPMVRILSGKIGTMCGLLHEQKLKEVINRSPVPVMIEGGISSAQHVKKAFHLGTTVVLLNSAFRYSNNPSNLASQLRKVVDSIFSDISVT